MMDDRTLDQDARREVMQYVRVLQTIVLALGMGVFSFGSIALFLSMNNQVPAKLGTLSFVALAMSAVHFLASLVSGSVITSIVCEKAMQDKWQYQAMPKTDAGKLAAVYQIKTIVTCAILEAAAFLAIFAFMQEHHVITLGVSAFLLVCILARVPTYGRIQSWIIRQQRRMKEDAMLRP